MHRLRHGRSGDPGRRRRIGARPDRRPPGVRVRAGFYGGRRVPVGDQRRQDRQDHGSGDEARRADRRPQRLGRRAHSGRRDVARRLRRHLSPQHARVRCCPADFRHHGAVRRRRRLFAGDHRLHADGETHELHVRHRPGGDQDGHARGRHEGRARRRDDAQRDERRRAFRRGHRPRVPRAHPRSAVVHAVQQPRRSAPHQHERLTRPRGREPRSPRAGIA